MMDPESALKLVRAAAEARRPQRAIVGVGAVVLGFGFEPFQANVKSEFGLGS